MRINGKPYSLSDAELYRMNTYATLLYLDKLTAQYGVRELKSLQEVVYTDEYGRRKTGLDFVTDPLWLESRKEAMDTKMNEILDIDRLIEKTK